MKKLLALLLLLALAVPAFSQGRVLSPALRVIVQGGAAAAGPDGNGTITFVANAEATSAINGGNATITLPAMTQWDVVYVLCALSSTAGAGGTSSSGWTQIGSTTDNTIRTLVFRKVMGAVPDTSFVCLGTGDANDSTVALSMSLRGVDIDTPEDAAPTTATGSSTNPDSPSITTTINNAFNLSIAASGVSDATFTRPTGYSNQVDDEEAVDTNDISGGITHNQVETAGAEDPGTWTGWSTGPWVAWSVAVRPLQ